MKFTSLSFSLFKKINQLGKRRHKPTINAFLVLYVLPLLAILAAMYFPLSTYWKVVGLLI